MLGLRVAKDGYLKQVYVYVYVWHVGGKFVVYHGFTNVVPGSETEYGVWLPHNYIMIPFFGN